MPTPIYSLPFHTIAQMRAVAGILRECINAHAPTTNDGKDWTPPADYAEVVAADNVLDAAAEALDIRARDATAGMALVSRVAANGWP
jgi:hypothetical protein